MPRVIPELDLGRFAADLDALVAPGAGVGVAVSGGPDSLALLLLAAAARPGLVEAATVDHRLRAEAADEAVMVAALCANLGVPHAILMVDWAEPPTANLQERAREARYRALKTWAGERGLAAVATAHHRDDQAETVLMRLARGSGVGGLAGIERSRPIGPSVQLIRPVLGWTRAELAAVVAASGFAAIDDPSNRDERFDRTRARAVLASTDWLDPARLAAAADHCRDAEDALAWATAQELARRHSRDGDTLILDPHGLPRELRRRLLLAGLDSFGCDVPPGPKLSAALVRLEEGGVTTLAGLKLEGGAAWRLSAAPARRRSAP